MFNPSELTSGVCWLFPHFQDSVSNPRSHDVLETFNTMSAWNYEAEILRMPELHYVWLLLPLSIQSPCSFANHRLPLGTLEVDCCVDSMLTCLWLDLYLGLYPNAC